MNLPRRSPALGPSAFLILCLATCTVCCAQTDPLVIDCGKQTDLPEPAAPLLVVTDPAHAGNPFGCYLTEILRGEGLLSFQTAVIPVLMADEDPGAYLERFSLVLLAETSLDDAECSLFRDYVSSGGALLAMRPDPALADLLGLVHRGVRSEQSLQYFVVDTGSDAGSGICGQSLQYHGEADNYLLDGAAAVAWLCDSADLPSAYPAVTLHSYGEGRAAAFTFDLAKSVVLMRQGNPDWQNSEGDGLAGYRPLDLFFRTNGARWVDRNRLAIPQADEAQRLLANLILALPRGPLPRMWYLPGRHKVVVVNTGDGEGDFGPALAAPMRDAAAYGGRFTVYLREAGIGGTTVGDEEQWRLDGHEVGVHSHGPDMQYAALYSAFGSIVEALQGKFGHGSRTARNHTLDWVGWCEMAEIELAWGVRLDLNQYHYPVAWDGFANGYLTGSGLPQRFSDEDGRLLGIYQALTQWPDEWFADRGLTAEQTTRIVEEMIATAEDGAYSFFVNNIHPVRYNGWDITWDWANRLWALCRDRGIPMWTAEMLVDFVDARNGAAFGNLVWDEAFGRLSFDFTAPSNRTDLTVMIPFASGRARLVSVEMDGVPVSVDPEEMKGRLYAMLSPGVGSARIVAVYLPDTDAPIVSHVRVESVAETTALIAWDTDEPATGGVDYGTAPADLRLRQEAPGYTTRHAASIAGLEAGRRYWFRVDCRDRAGNVGVSDIMSFAAAWPRWVETTEADFADGLFDGVRSVGTGDASLRLAATIGFRDPFDGSELDDTEWLARNPLDFEGPTDVSVNGGRVTVTADTYVRTIRTWPAGVLEGGVTLGDGSNAHFGWATTVQAGDDGIDDPQWAIFSVRDGQYYARTRLPEREGEHTVEIDTPLPHIAVGVPHSLRIVWFPGAPIEFWVDRHREVVHERSCAETMRAYLGALGTQRAIADWVSVASVYRPGGVYESSVFDAGGLSGVLELFWKGAEPEGTAIVFDVRSSPDGVAWTAWAPVGSDGVTGCPDGRHIQYRAAFSSRNGWLTPWLDEVSVRYRPLAPAVAPGDVLILY